MHGTNEGTPGGRIYPNLGARLILLLAISLRLVWFAYTRYTEEDAFITFRFAREIASGNGFVYNVGEKVYGTTTPLLTLLLVPWFKITQDIIPAATALDLLAAAGEIYFVWQALRFLKKPLAQQIFPLAILALSPKLIGMEMQGMETSLAVFFMAASWYAWLRGRSGWTGVLLGLLLWTRADLFLWPLTLGFVELLSSPKRALQMAGAAGLVYLPWLVFAWLYFGSPIPFTVTAKWVAYVQNNSWPLTTHLGIVLNYLSPVDVSQGFLFLAPIFALLTLGLAAWKALGSLREKPIAVLPLLACLEIFLLVITRATFFTRYFVPILWGVLILAGLELGTIWEKLASRGAWKAGYIIGLSAALLTLLGFGIQAANAYRDKQFYRQEESLKAIGLWFNQNTPVGTTVLLEPLGYVGYYSDRVMIDEVGLVTPEVVELKSENSDADLYFSVFHPDFFVLHCDDALRLLGLTGLPDKGLARQYRLIRIYNPLQFNSLVADNILITSLARNSCYQIWQRIGK